MFGVTGGLNAFVLGSVCASWWHLFLISLQLMIMLQSVWPTCPRTPGKQICRSFSDLSVPSLGSIWLRTRTQASPRWEMWNFWVLWAQLRMRNDSCNRTVNLRIKTELCKALFFFWFVMWVLHISNVFPSNSGLCFHQLPSARRCCQSHLRCVWLWIRSSHSQCGMGQVSVPETEIYWKYCFF